MASAIWYTFFPMPHNPEHKGRQPPEPGGRRPEGQPLPYYLAARFPTKQAAEKPYKEAQETIRTMDCDLSAYRFFVPQQLTELRPWYVTVIGEQPSDEVHRKVTSILSQGEMTSLPDQAIDELLNRRAEQIQKGSWVEAHYTLNVQRRNPKKEKLKSKQQKQSRRRNRGK